MLPLVLAVVRRIRKPGKYSWRVILPWVLRKPQSWAGWWPKPLRGRYDLWDRLPEAVRQVRVMLMPLGGIVLLLLPVLLGAHPWPGRVVGLPLLNGLLWCCLGVFFWRVFRLHRWGRRMGLQAPEINRLVREGDASPLWKKPHIQKLLLPVGAVPQVAPGKAPKTPAEYVEALLHTARGLEGPPRPLAQEAAAAARDVLSAIERLDQQIEALARDADPAEQARLEQKIKALGAPAEHETEAQRRMRQLLEEQRELARSLARQLKAAQERRAHLADVLGTLWLQIANLRAHYDEAAFDSSSVSARIRAIRDDAKRYIEASAEAARLGGPRE